MSKKFKHLLVPEGYRHYWSKYPEGYTILEALLNWVDSVNQLTENVNDWNIYLDDFVENFDEKIRPTVREMLNEMEQDGRLADIINEEIFNDIQSQLGVVEQSNNQLVQDVASIENNINSVYLNVKDFGAIGDGAHDDAPHIQEALDLLFEQNGGTLYFPTGEYLINTPLIVKLPASTGSYTYPPIKLAGQSNNGSVILKENQIMAYGLDSAVIAINGNTMDLDSSISALHFDSIYIRNNSPASLTYGVYIRRGSRVIVNYSGFATLRDLENIDNHDRYAFYAGSMWSSTFSDSAFYGDYGFYLQGDTTSILLENLYSSCLKIGYRLTGAYSTMNNCFGDYAHGVLFTFHFASWNITAIGGESRDCSRMIEASNSSLNIGSAFFNQSRLDDGVVIRLHNSNITIDNLRVDMIDDIGYLWRGGSHSTLKIKRLKMLNGFKFNYIDDSTMATQRLNISVDEDDNHIPIGARRLYDNVSGYWDWYIKEPKRPLNNLLLGLKAPTTSSNDEDIQWSSGGNENDVYINANFKERNVLGWVRKEQTSRTLRDGVNNYIPLIISGSTDDRPDWKTPGMMYFDTTIQKPIWWTGSGWVDSSGNDV